MDCIGSASGGRNGEKISSLFVEADGPISQVFHLAEEPTADPAQGTVNAASDSGLRTIAWAKQGISGAWIVASGLPEWLLAFTPAVGAKANMFVSSMVDRGKTNPPAVCARLPTNPAAPPILPASRIPLPAAAAA